MSFRIPEQFQLGGRTYTVKLSQPPRLDSKYIGQTDHSMRELVIDSHLEGQARRETFLHEAVHVIDAVFDVGLKEAQTKRLTGGLIQLLDQLVWGGDAA